MLLITGVNHKTKQNKTKHKALFKKRNSEMSAGCYVEMHNKIYLQLTLNKPKTGNVYKSCVTILANRFCTRYSKMPVTSQLIENGCGEPVR